MLPVSEADAQLVFMVLGLEVWGFGCGDSLYRAGLCGVVVHAVVVYAAVVCGVVGCGAVRGGPVVSWAAGCGAVVC